MPTLYEGFGIEELIDDVEITLMDKLNDAITYQQDRLAERDIARARRRNMEYEPLEVEMISPENFHTWSIPSFVQSEDRLDDYPMVVIVPGRIAPDAEDARMDQIDVFQNFISIHLFAKAGPIAHGNNQGDNSDGMSMPDLAGRRAARYAEAVYQIVKTDRDLRRKLSGNSAPMNVLISEPWYFTSGDGHGDQWCWIAIGTEYQIRNYSRTPEEV